MSFQDLRRAIEGEIFDYQILMHHLKEYKKPRDKITLLLKNGSIIRVKKGLYVFGPDYQKRGVSQEILANLIYTPSYISLEYALSTHGLIPERSYGVTNICLNRSRTFITPLGTFIYKTRPLSVYPIGINRIENPREGGYLIASKEKALVDLVSDAGIIEGVVEMQEYLYENMRMDRLSLKNLNKKFLIEILKSYNMPTTLIEAIYD